MMYSRLLLLLASTVIGRRFVADSDGQTTIKDKFSLSSTLRDVLVDNKVISEVLDDFEPSYYLDITWPEHHETVLLGNDIPTKAVQHRPTFTFHSLDAKANNDKNSTFTLALTDPDAKSRDNPKWSEMCHWIMTNLTTPLPAPHLLKKVGELKGYRPPGPPPKTGAHRYVFVLLEGESSDLEPPKERQHWGYGKNRHGVRDWAAENVLKVVSANFFFAENKEQ